MKHQNVENNIAQSLLEKIHENNFLFIDELKKTMTDLIDNQSTIQDKIISLIGPGLTEYNPKHGIITPSKSTADEKTVGVIEEKTSIKEYDKLDIQQACKKLFESHNSTIDLLNKL